MDNFFINELNRLTSYQRYKTRVVTIGAIPLGGHHPIRIQSMTNTPTMDTEATVAQTIRLAEAGCDYVRITAPSVKEAENLAVIKARLRAQGYDIPLIADIHFVPRAAEVAARIVEKVRVNPGNYADRKRFQDLNYDPSEYEAELERIRDRFTPLVRLCREAGTAMRIGANHGSLSDRILSHYGDTPLGMVESAMEFVRICADENYHELVISMKASNTRVMIQAYRLLVHRMEQEGFNYPLHLGVTEAGDGDDARIKSALGIGSLLKDGFGDTIRVSLTEAPEAEVPVARSLVSSLTGSTKGYLPELTGLPLNLFEYQRRSTESIWKLGADHVPVVVADLSDCPGSQSDALIAAGLRYDLISQSWLPGDTAADILYFAGGVPDFQVSENTVILCDSDYWMNLDQADSRFPLFDLASYKTAEKRHTIANFVRVNDLEDLGSLTRDTSIVWVLNTSSNRKLAALRRFILELINSGSKQPVILSGSYDDSPRERFILDAASDLGALFNDGLADGIWLNGSEIPLRDVNEIAFGILQASRSRMTKTEYIACPSCGRTLFDLEEVTAQIRARTGHLKGLKIGIMGCVVNGPGEMADADFGYVGTGPGKVSLYRGQLVVRPHLPQAEAVDSLIELIKSEGYWVEP